MKDLADVAVVIPTTETPRAQEGYMTACHAVCGIVEREMFGPKAVFIDRDDTIAPDVPYCDDPKKFNVFDHVPESIKKLNDAGYMVIIVTNQSGIGRGYFDEDTLSRIHEKMKSQIGEAGGRIDDIFYCPHSPEENCSCRKPEIGLGEQAIEKYGIATSRSFMIGDSDKDVEFGKGIGCRTFRVDESFTFSDAVSEILGL
jgi:histidinol-phosphate phosphatase family protein